MSLRRGRPCCAGMSVIATGKIVGSSLLCKTPIEVADLAIRTNSTMTTWMRIRSAKGRQQEWPTLQKEGSDLAQSQNLSQSSPILAALTYTNRQPWTRILTRTHLVKSPMTEPEYHVGLAAENSTKWPWQSMQKSAKKFSYRKDRRSTRKLLEHLKDLKSWRQRKSITNHTGRKLSQKPKKRERSRASRCPNGKRSLSCSDRRCKLQVAAVQKVVEEALRPRQWLPRNWTTVLLANFAIGNLLRSLVKDTFLTVRGSIRKTWWKMAASLKLLPREALKSDLENRDDADIMI